MAEKKMDTEPDVAEAPAEKKNFRLEVIREIKVAQSQNGLRHGDYQRYRQYCSRRLRRIRKSVAFTTEPIKKNFKLKRLEASHVTDARFLSIPLLNAERAWSYAMQLKDDLDEDNAHSKFHLLKRLTKAAQWSKALETLSLECTDTQTQLETEAYSSWMQGNLDLEKDRHKEALARFSHAKVVYEQLGRIGGMSLKALCDEKIASLEPSLRYCNYVMARRNKKDAKAAADVSTLMDGVGEMNELLKSKLAHVLDEKRAELAQALERVEWQGREIPLKNEKIQLGLVTATELESQLELSRAGVDSGKRAGVLEAISSAYDTALAAIREDIRNAEKLKQKGTTGNLGVSEDALLHLQGLKQYATFKKLKITKARNEALALALAEQMKQQQTEQPASKQQTKRIKPDDLVMLYEKVMDNLREMSELDALKLNLSDAEFQAQTLVAKAFRCFYLSESYFRFQKFNEAYALFGLTLERVREAGKTGDASTRASLSSLESETQGRLCCLQATVCLERLQTTDQLAVTGLKDKKKRRGPVLDNLDEYRASNELVSFPPETQACPCKPALFDLAYNELEFKDTSGRFPEKKAAGWLGSVAGAVTGGWFS